MALLNFSAKNADGTLVKRIACLPAGTLIKGEDGRAWTAKDRAAVLARLNKPGNKLVLDENHSSIRSAPKGKPSPALGFLTDWSEDANGVMSAAVEWTPYGETQAPGYGGVSPVLLHRAQRGIMDGTDVLGDITNLHSVALVNDPNLELPALNDREHPEDPTEMTPEQLAAALAPFSQALASIQADVAALKAVPAMNAKEAEVKTFELSVNSAAERFISAGKLPNTAESRAFVTKMAKTPEDLVAMNSFYDAAAAIVSTEKTDLNDKSFTKAPVLSTQQQKLMTQLGWKADELAALPGLSASIK